jgi:hypothetical protein
MGMVESRPGGPGRYADDLGDLGRGITQEVMEDEDRPLVGGQPPEPAFEQVTVGDGQQFVGRRRSVDRQHPKVGRTPTLARRLADAHIDEEALKPGVESVRIAEAPQVTPSDHQRVLQGILGAIDIPQDPMGDREETVAPNADQVDKRLPIPALRRLYKKKPYFTNGSAKDLETVLASVRTLPSGFLHAPPKPDEGATLDDSSRAALLAFLDLL